MVWCLLSILSAVTEPNLTAIVSTLEIADKHPSTDTPPLSQDRTEQTAQTARPVLGLDRRAGHLETGQGTS
ncbi:hypothetical protein LZ32DRAFT_606463 [Colletotrichum eremochloae]|nr:hypothetical protein LZ32DRAFT_606463 [Colletotrichum eremochloae]